MGKNKKEINLVMTGLKFSRSDNGVVCGNEKNTLPAVLMLIFSIILGTVIAFFRGNGGSSGLGSMGLTGLDAAIAQMGSLVIGTFLSAFIMVYVIRIFKVKYSFSGILRVYGAAIIWTILSSVFGWFVPPNLAILAIAFWFAYNFSVMFGLAGCTEIKIWKSFLSIVITFAVIFGIMILYGILIGSVFGG